MRDEGQADILARRATQALANFRQMTMTFYRIGLHAFRRLGVQRTYSGTTPGTTDTGFAVGDQTRCVGQTCFQQWQETQLRCGRIATRHRDQARFPDLLAIDFRQTIDRFVQQLRCAVWLAVPLGPFISILQTEVSGQVDDLGARRQQLACQGVSHAVWRGEENHIAGAKGFHVRHAERQPVIVTAQVRVHVSHGQTGLGSGSDDDHFCLRMLCQQTQQFDTGVTRAADDTDLDHKPALNEPTGKPSIIGAARACDNRQGDARTLKPLLSGYRE